MGADQKKCYIESEWSEHLSTNTFYIYSLRKKHTLIPYPLYSNLFRFHIFVNSLLTLHILNLLFPLLFLHALPLNQQTHGKRTSGQDQRHQESLYKRIIIQQ